MKKLSAARRQRLFTKLATIVITQDKKARRLGTASRALSYGGTGGLLASFLAQNPKHSRALAAGGLAAILGSMVTRDIARNS